MLLKPKEEHNNSGDSSNRSSSDNDVNVDVRGRKKPRSSPASQNLQSIWTWRPLTLVATALALLLLAAILHSAVYLQVDPQGCKMSMMSPSYIKLSGFDTEHSRFATKYSLYLYREEGVDEYTSDNIGLRGAPVLFIPGNAGSYKQVRSLSSEASRYYAEHLKTNEEKRKEGVRAFDFFTLNFNEDLSAFHGQTLVDQAEYVNEAISYILGLYHEDRRLHTSRRKEGSLPDPSSVILIGHSMGGIVARTVLVTSKYQANSVNTIITMSTPHARPPVSFDAEMVSLYDMVNGFWRESYTQKEKGMNPLAHTTLISIAGGGRDTTVPSDYTSLGSLVPETHGFTVFTSGIPTVWTSMDHLAITWADQVRKVIVKSLYEVVDVRRAGQTKERKERMEVFRKWFLTGLEDGARKSLPGKSHEVLLTLGSKRPIVEERENVTIRHLGAQDERSARLLTVPLELQKGKKHFSFMTSKKMRPDGTFDGMEVLFCSTFPLSSGTSSHLLDQIDLSNADPSATRLACKRPGGDGVLLPASTRSSRNAYENAFDSIEPFTYLQYDAKDLQGFQFVAIVDKAVEISHDWTFAEFADTGNSIVESDTSLFRLLVTGANFKLPASRPLMNEIRIPALHSSLMAYTMKIRQQSCGTDSEMFTPLLRQHIESPYESKYFVNFKQGDINLHGVAPFVPPNLDGSDPNPGVAFQIWSDPTCESSLEVKLKHDLTGSLGKLLIRYRTIFAVFPLLVVAMVLRKQFRVYDNTGVFITFSDSLEQSLRLPLPILLMSMTFFATAFTSAGANSVNNTLSNTNGTSINFGQNDLLLGSQDTFFWFLVPLAGLICVGACVILHYLVLGLLHGFVLCSRVVTYRSEQSSGSSPPTSVFVASTPRRRLINTVALLFLVATIIPYPFAYVVACIVQLTTCTRALRYAQDSRSGSAINFFNYTYAILILMLWVLPINLPVLMVWIHNLAVKWLEPFSSHHNVLSIMPFILLVETLSSGVMVPVLRRGWVGRWATNLLFFVLAVYASMYGMTYAYRLHYIANIIALWLVCLHFGVGQAHIGGNVSAKGKIERSPARRGKS